MDLDAPDSYLVDSESEWKSKWLLKNCVFVRLSAGAKFYDSSKLPQRGVKNKFSLFAETVKKRRLSETS